MSPPSVHRSVRARRVRAGRGWPLVALLALGAQAAAPAGPGACAAERLDAAPAQVHVDRYRGRWADDPRFEERFGALAERVEWGLEEVAERLGLRPRVASDIHVYVVDVDLGRFGLDRARSWSRVERGRPVHLVALFTEYYLSGDSDLEMTLVHELTHAVMRERMGQRAYERLPYWVREGLAVHTAREGEHHLRRNLQVAEDVEALLTGLMTSRRTLLMYPYAWLAIDLIEGRGGAGSVARFAEAVVQGEPVGAAIERLTGLGFEAFEAALREHVRARVQAEADGLGDLKAAKRLYARRRRAEALEAFEGFLAAHPASCFAPTARYYRARALYLLGRRSEARDAFEECLALDLGHSGLGDEAQLHLGICHYHLGATQEAERHLRRFVNLHPHSNEIDHGLLYLGRALARLGARAEAREVLRAVAEARGARDFHKRSAQHELARLAE